MINLKQYHRFLVLAIILGISLVLTVATIAEGKPKVALLLKTETNPYFITVKEGALKGAEEAGVELDVFSPVSEVDMEDYLRLFENALAKGYQAIVFVPVQSAPFEAVVKKAYDKGVYVIAYDTKWVGPGEEYITSFIGTNNFEGAKSTGEYIGKLLNGKGKVAIIEGMVGNPAAIDRREGFKDGLKNYPDIEVVVSLPADWDADKALTVAENILTAHPDLNSIFACNDQMVQGALRAVEAAGKAGKVYLQGFDGITSVLKLIKEGKILSDVVQSPWEMGHSGVINAKKAIVGESFEKEVWTGQPLVTKDNVDEFLEK